MAAANTDHFQGASNGTRPSPTTLTAIHTVGQTTITVGAVTGWRTTTGVGFIIYTIDASGNKVAGSQTDWVGTVSGTTITNLVLKAGTDSGYSVGAIVECAPTAAWADAIVDGVLVAHNQDGSHATSAISSTAMISNGIITPTKLTADAQAGWNTTVNNTAIASPNTVTYNGNRNYSLVFNAIDYTPYLSNGMRLKLTRTVTAPTQSTSLNGTTQYYSKTTPAGMTFTDDFVVSAWIKLTSYGVAYVASRYNGTSGWGLNLSAAGQVALTGFNAGAANYSQIQSYASLPLNKWVHIAAQLDMSAFTATTTTSYVMFDGIDVAAAVTRGGTNPTALIQAGNLEIGGQNGGANPLPGKVAQVAIYSAKVTQATVTASISQTLAGTETSLISAYSFNNSINDLNANANNLTANGSAVATNADSPFAGGVTTPYTAGTTEFGEVFNASFSTNTTLVVQVPDGYAIPTSGGVSAVAYSSTFSPLGWPGAITQIGYASTAAAFSATPGAGVYADFSGLTCSPYIPVGRKVKITFFAPSVQSTSAAGNTTVTAIREGTTDLAQSTEQVKVAGYAETGITVANISPTSGSHTYKASGLTSGAGTVQIANTSASAPAFLSVELV